jgi:hypothetical protein
MFNKRTTYAKGIETLLDRNANRMEVLPPYRPLQTAVAVSAAENELRMIAKVLRSDAPVSSKTLADVKALLTDGADSPLFRKDAAAARTAAATVCGELNVR